MTEAKYTLIDRCLCELLGTFILVFAGITAVDADYLTKGMLGLTGVGLVFGLAVIISAYSLGHISGAHLNPAVTVGLTLTGRFKYDDLIPYVASQLLGGIFAGIVELAIFGTAFTGSPTYLGTTVPNPALSQPLSAFIMETFVTMFLVITVLGSTHEKAPKNFAGLAIGLALAMGVMIAGGVSGGSLNPARTFGPALVSWTWTDHWVYWLGPLFGAYLAAGIYRRIFE
jgi:aquaporin NIP